MKLPCFGRYHVPYFKQYHLEVFHKNVDLENFAKIYSKSYSIECFYGKVTGLKPTILLKRTPSKVFPVRFVSFFQDSYSLQHSLFSSIFVLVPRITQNIRPNFNFQNSYWRVSETLLLIFLLLLSWIFVLH